MSSPCPALSVVMPVHNARPFLDASIESILGQTFRDFELIILDDASTDGSTHALREWARQDERIRLVESPARLGLVGSSNTVVAHARAPLVARMDADDLSHRERLARQMQVFTEAPDVVLVGALSDGIDHAGRHVRPRDRWRVLRASPYPPFPHGSVVFRRAAFDSAGGYRDACIFWEDQDLFLRLARLGRVLVLPQILYRYRYLVGHSATTTTLDNLQRVYDIQQRCLTAFAEGRDYDDVLESSRCTEPGAGAAQAVYRLAATRLWAGRRPGLLRAALTRGIGTSRRGVFTLVFVIWGAMNPTSLRLALRWFVRTRDAMAGWWISEEGAYPWRFR